MNYDNISESGFVGYRKNYISISMMPEYRDLTFEELRYEYEFGRKRKLSPESPNIVNKRAKYTENIFRDFDQINSSCKMMDCSLEENDVVQNYNRNKKRTKSNVSLDSPNILKKRAKLNTSIVLNETVDRLCDDINTSYKKIDCSSDDEDKNELKENTNRDYISISRRRRVKRSTFNNDKDKEKAMVLSNEMRKMGNEYLKKDMLDEAYECYSKALVNSTCKVINSLAYANRAYCLMKQERYKDALNDCNEAIECDPKYVKAKVRKIKCLFELDELDEAEILANEINDEYFIEECQSLVKLIQEKKQFQIYMNEINRLFQSDNYSLGYNYVVKALDLDPDNKKLLFLKIEVAFYLQKYSIALQDCDILLNEWDDLKVVLYKSRCLMKMERFEEAKSLLLSKDRTNEAVNQCLIQIQTEERQANNRNYYQILNVAIDSTESEIKKSYRQLSRKYHPDKLVACHDPEMRKIQENKFKQLTEIYSTLSDPVKRRMYNIEHNLYSCTRRYP